MTTPDPTDSEVTERLEPCPFCDSDDVECWASRPPDRNQDIWCVFCHQCSCEGPEKLNEAEAIQAWNTRRDQSGQRVNLLLRYVDHRKGCASYTNSACTCGLESAMRELFETRASSSPIAPSTTQAGEVSAAPVVNEDKIEEIRRWRERFTSYHSDHAVALRRAFGYIDYLLERVAAAPLAADPTTQNLIAAFRDTAIKAHIAFTHKGPWEDCEWIECEDRRKMIEAACASTPTDNDAEGG